MELFCVQVLIFDDASFSLGNKRSKSCAVDEAFGPFHLPGEDCIKELKQFSISSVRLECIRSGSYFDIVPDEVAHHPFVQLNLHRRDQAVSSFPYKRLMNPL